MRAIVVSVISLVSFFSVDALARTCVPPSSSRALGSLAQRDTVPTNLVLFSTEVSVDTPEIIATSRDGSDVVVLTPVDIGAAFRFERERDLLLETDYDICATSLASRSCAPVRATATDDDAPPAPTATIEAVLGQFSLDTSCDGEGTNTTAVFVEGDIEGDTAHVVLRRSVNGNESIVADIQNLPLRDNHFNVSDSAEEGGDAIYSVTAIDLAGNESEPTELVQSLGCPGSCAQADVAPFAIVLGVLAAQRRRSR